MNMSLQVIAADGTVTAANLNRGIGEELPKEGIVILNASNPGDPVTVNSVTYQGNGAVTVEFDGLPEADAGTVLIPPLLPGWSDSVGRVIGGFYGGIPGL